MSRSDVDPQGALRIKINPNTASKRTRKCVKKNGPLFEWYENESRPGEILLRGVLSGWFGWLPKTEIEMTNF